MRHKKTALVASGALAAIIGSAVVSTGALGQSPEGTSPRPQLGVAEYDPNGRLVFPGDADRWIVLGAGLGGDYADLPFDPANPGTIGVVQMEPAAYDYFLEHRRYADGTMLLLTFYAVQEKPQPALQGFVQGGIAQREIHVIDRERYPEEGRAFFVFRPAAEPAVALPAGNACFECHSEHGAFDATFTQFYPAVRDLVPAEGL